MEEFNLNNIIYKKTKFKNLYVTQDGQIAKIQFQNNCLKSYFLMEHEITKDGYHRVKIYHKHYLVHRIVYQTWGDEELDNEKVVDHIDANPANNHINNLRQVEQKENIRNAINHRNFGHNHNTKIKVYDEITKETMTFESIKDFFIYIGAPSYIIKHGGLSSLNKRKEYKRYKVFKIDEH